MIIQSVFAERLHRYQSLRLRDLPERGIIAVSGDNETGKSAIGEIVCFALFGRTYALAGDRIGKLVQWGARQGSVTLCFRSKGRGYEVIRHLARDGEQSARLNCPEESDEPLVRGRDAVRARIERILGFGFDEYVETYYLAQREITTPHPQSPAVKTIVGTAPLEQCAAEVEKETGAEGEGLVQLETQIAKLEREISGLIPEHERVTALERELAEDAGRRKEIEGRLKTLQSAADGYRDASRGGRSFGFRHGMARFLTFLILLLVVLELVFWAMLHFYPDLWPMPQLRDLAHWFLGSAGLPALPASLYLGVVILVVLLAINWLWMLSLGLRRRGWRIQARRLAEELDRLDAMDTGAGVPPAAVESALGSEPTPGPATPVVDKPDPERRLRLRQRILDLEAAPEEVSAAVQHESAWMRRQLGLLSAGREEREAVLARAREDHETFHRLSREREALDAKLAELQERIATGRLACELLEGAAQQMTERFSARLRAMVSKALPQFTEGRYDHLHVDELLQVRVYSGDKRNLLDLDEISSGTQRQIMLALRLGLAQELVSNVVRDDQFAFLDEPFAFFDTTRLRGALRTLSELGGDLVQFWVVAQRFPQDVHIGLEIACGGHPDTLEVGFPSTD